MKSMEIKYAVSFSTDIVRFLLANVGNGYGGKVEIQISHDLSK